MSLLSLPLSLGTILAAVVSATAGAVRGVGDAADAELLRRAVRGEAGPVRIVTRRLNPAIQARVMRVLRRLTPAHLDDAPDVVQGVWLALLKDEGRQLLAFDPARGISLEAYVGMIAERETRNHIQHRAAGVRRPSEGFAPLEDADLEAAATPSPEAEVGGRELEARLLAYLEANLGERGLAVLRIVFTDEQTPEAAAQMLGCTLQVVYNWQHKIRGLARTFLAEAAARSEG